MALDLVNHEKKMTKAVATFWANRDKAREKQLASGKSDQGERASVTAGKNMDGFLDLIIEPTGSPRPRSTKSGPWWHCQCYFRPTKLWDLLVIHRGQLIAAIELKSQVGPSFGNNFNNRTEEAIGTAHDFWTAYREGAFGQQPRPFAGWLMLVEDAPASRKEVKDKSPHFPVSKEFQGASYLKRYDVLCRRLMQEQLYTTAALVTSPRSANKSGEHAPTSDMTSFKTFVTRLAGHIAGEAARLP
ncbi:MAG: hypothetical protein ACI83N_001917 [Hydrogenophaga sp.]|jgi:hypothetical protein